MLNLSEERLKELGAEITAREIGQQPDLWREVLINYATKKEEIREYLKAIETKHEKVKVIFSGAGSSAFVGDTIEAYLNQKNEDTKWEFEAIATTDIVATPEKYLQKEIPTLLVSFARSGNSPESVATIDLAQQYVDELYQLTITCAAEGKLAVAAEGDDRNLVLLQPEKSNDAGFAMTGSFTSMMLTALLVFDTSSDEEKLNWANNAIEMSEQMLADEEVINSVVELDFDRVVYLGQGGFFGLAHEAQLKLLELTAGRITTLYETPLGFRHGPKSFVNEKTVIIQFNSNNDYTRKYDTDLLNEVFHDKIAAKVLALSVGENVAVDADQFWFDEKYRELPDAYLSFPYVVFAQLFSLAASIKTGVQPDNPSPAGTVNRVVQGVIIHPHEK